MKIAFLSHLDLNLYLFRLSWMKALVLKGHDVCAVVPEGKYSGKFRDHGIRTVNYTIERGGLNPLSELSTILELRKIFKQEGFDVLHTFTIKPNIYGSLAGRSAGIRLIINHVTGLGYIYTEKNPRTRILKLVAGLLYRISFGLAGKVVFQNPDDLAVLAELLDPSKAVIIKGTGVDTDFFSPGAVRPSDTAEIRKELSIDEKTVVVTLIARLLWNKGIREFMEAAGILSGKYGNLRFVLVGWIDEGNPASADEDFIRDAKKNPNIRFLGEREDIREILYITHIYALPSYREGTPRTVLEAMAMGKPVVTTDAPGCRQTVEEGVNGFLVGAGDGKALAAAVEKLVLDRDLRERMGRLSREKVQREFSDKVVIGRILELYN